jgi:SAM-dependent methyltransferase
MSYDKFAQDWHLLQSNSKNNLAHKFLEKPAMKKLIPKIKNAEVFLLGCGSGEEIEIFDKELNYQFYGIDKSLPLIEYAQINYPQHNFEAISLEDWQSTKQYDIVYSSLTFHYIEDWNQLLTKIYNSLKPGGQLIFSTHHPIKWGSSTARSKITNKYVLGYEKNKMTSEFTIWGDYLNSRQIDDTLFGKIPITHFHKPISEMINCFIQNKFNIIKMVEPKPIIETKKSHPDFYESYSKIPLFVIFKLEKR